MGSGGSKEKHYSKEAYPYGRSSYRVEELLQSSAYTTWAMEFEHSDAFKKYQTLPEKLPREVERDLLDRHIKENLEQVSAEVKQELEHFTAETSVEKIIAGKPLSFHLLRFAFVKLSFLNSFLSYHLP